MTTAEAIEVVVTRVRRATRNADVLAICDEVDRLKLELANAKPVRKTADRTEYNRTYMQEYRQGKRRKGKRK